MEYKLRAVKHGDIQGGDWQWAVGADHPRYSRPVIVATINFRGAVFVGYSENEALAHQFAAAPSMVGALSNISALARRSLDIDGHNEILALIEGFASTALQHASAKHKTDAP